MAFVELDQSVLSTVGVRKETVGANLWLMQANINDEEFFLFIFCTQSCISQHHRDGLTLDYRQPNLRQARNMRLTMTYAMLQLIIVN